MTRLVRPVRRFPVLTVLLALVGPLVALLGPAGSATAAQGERVRVPTSWTIKGSGYGHGVGMAQYGAFAMALQGRTAEQILEYYYAGAQLDTANNPDPDIAVQVFGAPGDARATTLTLGSGEWTLRASTDESAPALETGGAARAITLEAADGQVRAVVKQGGSTVATVRKPTLVLDWAAAGGAPAVVSVAGAHGRYRHGTLTATNISGRVNVVNTVRIHDEYLYGIDEMPSLWGSDATGGFAALQAQAIVARTYALRAKTARTGHVPMASCNCHLYDDTRSQHFTGWLKEGGQAGDVWREAVDSTRDGDLGSEVDTVDIVRLSDGSFAETPFFSRSGRVVGAGRGTADNSDVFGTAQQSHLVHRTDPYSFAGEPDRKYLSWTDRLTQRTAQRLFGLRRVARIAVVARYSSGQVRTLKAVTPGGKAVRRTKTADGWRVALGVNGAWIAGFTARR